MADDQDDGEGGFGDPGAVPPRRRSRPYPKGAQNIKDRIAEIERDLEGTSGAERERLEQKLDELKFDLEEQGEEPENGNDGPRF